MFNHYPLIMMNTSHAEALEASSIFELSRSFKAFLENQKPKNILTYMGILNRLMYGLLKSEQLLHSPEQKNNPHWLLQAIAIPELQQWVAQTPDRNVSVSVSKGNICAYLKSYWSKATRDLEIESLTDDVQLGELPAGGDLTNYYLKAASLSSTPTRKKQRRKSKTKTQKTRSLQRAKRRTQHHPDYRQQSSRVYVSRDRVNQCLSELAILDLFKVEKRRKGDSHKLTEFSQIDIYQVLNFYKQCEESLLRYADPNQRFSELPQHKGYLMIFLYKVVFGLIPEAVEEQSGVASVDPNLLSAFLEKMGCQQKQDSPTSYEEYDSTK